MGECRRNRYNSSRYFISVVAVWRYLLAVVRFVVVERRDIRLVFIIAVADQIYLKAVATLDVADRGDIRVAVMIFVSK